MKKKTKIKKTLKTLTINRDKWGKGALLTPDDKMCCLGFACQALNYDLKEELARVMPRSEDDYSDVFGMPKHIKLFAGPKWLLDQYWATEAAEANDELNGKLREDTVRELFAQNGCKVSFIGGKKKPVKKAVRKAAPKKKKRAHKKPVKQKSSVPQSTSGGSLYRDTDYSKDDDRFSGSRGDTW